jgi:hypothetical protein
MTKPPQQDLHPHYEGQMLAQEVRKLRLEHLLKIAGLIYIAAFSFGAILTFVYFYRNEFISGGISAADTVLFCLISLGFLVTLMFAIASGSLLAFPVVRGISEVLFRFLRNKRNSDTEMPSQYIFEWDKGNWPLAVLGGVVLTTVIYAAWHMPSRFTLVMSGLFLLGVVPCTYMFGSIRKSYSLLKPKEDAAPIDRWVERLSPKQRHLFFTTVMTVIVCGFFVGASQDMSFTLLGIRKSDVTVRVTKEDFELLARQALVAGIPLNSCETVDMKDPVVRNADVLWHRIGTHALVRHPSVPLGETREPAMVRIEPLGSSITVVDSNAQPEKCVEFTRSNLFSLGTPAEMRTVAHQRLELKLDGIVRDEATLRLRAIYPKAEQGKAKTEMETLKNALVQRLGFPAERVIIEVEGNGPDKWQCEQLPASVQHSCKQANERIELRIGSVNER